MPLSPRKRVWPVNQRRGYHTMLIVTVVTAKTTARPG